MDDFHALPPSMNAEEKSMKKFVSSLTSGLVAGPLEAGDFTILRTEHSGGLRLGRHDHEFATMVVVCNGEFEETVGARSFRCTPGSILIKPAGAHHSNRYDHGGSTAILASLPDAIVVREVTQFRQTAAMQRLAFEFRWRDAASELVCETLLLGLLQRAPDAPIQHQPPPWLRSVEERLRCEPVPGLGALAASVDRDPVHVAREFRRHYGCSPGEYARSARIERACELLRRSDESIAAIALAAGFYDQSHFTNVFRRLVGTTPADYRRQAAISHRSSKTT